MSRTHARRVAAGVVCALGFGGCGSADDPDAGGSGAASSNGGASGFSSGGVTFSDGGGDRVTFSSGGDQVTFSGAQTGATFSSPGAASFSSQPVPTVPTTPVVPSVPVTDTVDPDVPTAGSAINPADAGAEAALGVAPVPVVDESPSAIDESSSVGGLDGEGLPPMRGTDPLFGFWSADDMTVAASPAVSEERVFRIALHGEEIRIEWFSDEAREGGSGRNCWSADARDPVRLVEEGEAFVTAGAPGDGSRARYVVEPIGVLRVETYSDEGVASTTVHAPALAGLSFVDFPVCDGI